MVKTVVGIGCSHTAGCELDGKNGTSEYNRQNAFPGQIAKELNCNLINLGFNGGSNQYINRATTQFIANNFKNIQDYFFVIGWTSPERMELRYNDLSKYVFEPHPDNMDTKYVPLSLGQKDNIKMPLKRVTHCALDVFDRVMMLDHWAMYALNLQSLFKQYDIKYIMCNTCVPLEFTNNSKNIESMLDKNNYYMDQTYYHYSHKVKRHPKSLSNHFGIRAHQDWAAKLIMELRI